MHAESCMSSSSSIATRGSSATRRHIRRGDLNVYRAVGYFPCVQLRPVRRDLSRRVAMQLAGFVHPHMHPATDGRVGRAEEPRKRVGQLEREAPKGRRDEVKHPHLGGAEVAVQVPVIVHAAHHLLAESLDRRRVHSSNHARFGRYSYSTFCSRSSSAAWPLPSRRRHSDELVALDGGSQCKRKRIGSGWTCGTAASDEAGCGGHGAPSDECLPSTRTQHRRALSDRVKGAASLHRGATRSALDPVTQSANHQLSGSGRNARWWARRWNTPTLGTTSFAQVSARRWILSKG